MMTIINDDTNDRAYGNCWIQTMEKISEIWELEVAVIVCADVPLVLIRVLTTDVLQHAERFLLRRVPHVRDSWKTKRKNIKCRPITTQPITKQLDACASEQILRQVFEKHCGHIWTCRKQSTSYKWKDGRSIFGQSTQLCYEKMQHTETEFTKTMKYLWIAEVFTYSSAERREVRLSQSYFHFRRRTRFYPPRRPTCCTQP